MNGNERRRPFPIVGMVDIFFAVTMFLLLSSSFTGEVRLKIDLPEREGVSEDQIPPEILSVQIEESGQVWVGGEMVADSTIRGLGLYQLMVDKLQREKSARPDLVVQIKADEQGLFGPFAQVLSACGELGISPQVSYKAVEKEGR